MRGRSLELIGILLFELVLAVSLVTVQVNAEVTTGVPQNGGDLKNVSRILINSILIPYSGYDFHSIIRSSDKGFVTAEAVDVTVQGYDYEAGLVVKYDSDGKREWASTHLGRGDAEEAFYVVETSDGYAVAGTSFDPAYTTTPIQPYDISLYKIDSVGNELWSKTYDTGKNNSEEPRALLLAQDGGFVFIGDTDSMQHLPPNQGQTDLYVVKTNMNGDVQWSRVFGDPQYNDFGYSIIQTNDFGYAVVGAKYVSQDYGVPWESRAFLLKINANGDLQWTKTFGGTKQMSGGDPEAALSVVQTSDEEYVLAGHTNSFGAGKSDVYFIKTDSSGNEVWSWTYGGVDDDGASVVTRSYGDGGYLIGGYTYRVNSNGNREMDSYVVKTDRNGNMEWGIQEEVPDRNDEILPGIFLHTQAGGNYIWAKNVPEDRLVLVDEVKVVSSSASPSPTPVSSVTPLPTSTASTLPTSTASTSQGVLLSTEVTLDSYTPSRSYFYSLNGGDTISIDVGSSGDPANLRVNNNVGSQVYSQTGISSDSTHYWQVPYDGVFEFVIETTGTESLVAITLEASAGENPPDSFDYLPVIIIAVVAVILVLGTVFVIRHRKASPAAPPPPPPQNPQTPICPTCGGPLTYVAQYQRWYCYKEQKYV